ncbi:MAG: chloride channel protein [Gemmatimonadales bacterium]
MRDFSPFPRYLAKRTSDLGDKVLQQLTRWGVDETLVLLVLAAGVGTAVGGSILLFYRGIDLAATVVPGITSSLRVPVALATIATLALGLVIVRGIVHFGTKDSPGENIPDVMYAVARKGGVIHSVPVILKTVAAAVTLGSGGSVGAEGPVAVLGSALGSRVGRFFRFRPNRLKLLVGCGTAAGISGAFGAPIAGVFFALEEIIGSFRTMGLAPVVVASVAAAAVTRIGLGDDLVIRIPQEYSIGPTSDLFLYAMLGLLGGIVAVLYNRGVWKIHDLLSEVPGWLRLIFAAVVVGAVSSQFEPGLWGRGHQGLDLGLALGQSAWVLVLLAVAKIALTGLTLAGGGVGGVFTPALVIGGAFGSAVGVGLNTLFPGLGVEPIAFGLVGMAALVGGATHAPLTAIFMVLEMTNDYGLILPLMLGGTLAYVVAKRLHPESIYTEWLARRGERISHGTDEGVLQSLTVQDAYRNDPTIVLADATLASTLPTIRSSNQLEYPVVDSDNVVVGIFTWQDLKNALADPDLPRNTPIRDIAHPFSEGVTLGDDLQTALRQLGARDAQMLPVVDRVPPYHLRGIIGRTEIFAAYDRAVD